MEDLLSATTLMVLYPGYGHGDQATISVPHSVLALMRIRADQTLHLRVQDENPEQVQILGRATSVEPDDPYAMTAVPEPDNDKLYPPLFNFRFPQAWKDKHWRQAEEDNNDYGDDPYRQIRVEYNQAEAQSFLQADGSLVIPL